MTALRSFGNHLPSFSVPILPIPVPYPTPFHTYRQTPANQHIPGLTASTGSGLGIRPKLNRSL